MKMKVKTMIMGTLCGGLVAASAMVAGPIVAVVLGAGAVVGYNGKSVADKVEGWFKRTSKR